MTTSKSEQKWTIGKLLGREIRFSSSNYPDHCIRHKDFNVFLEPLKENRLYKLDSSFHIVPGISGSGISFQSTIYPDHFLRNKNFGVKLERYDGSDLFKNDASWFPREGLANRGCSFESVNNRGQYLRHNNFILGIARQDGTDLFDQDSTWLPEILKEVSLGGEWQLAYGNNNMAADWEYNQLVEVGTTISESHGRTVTDTFAWKVSAEGSYEGFGASVKTMFEASGTHSVEEVSTSSWESVHKETTSRTYSGKKGEPFYLWQWTLYANTSDGAFINVKSNSFEETIVNLPPAQPKSHNADIWTDTSRSDSPRLV